MSLGIHASVIALLILISSHPAIRRGALDAIDLAHSRVVRLVAPKPYRGGGGGGQQDLLPASRGRLPKFARRHFTPPSARPPEVQAVLVIEPTLIGPSDVKLPDLDFARLGDPLGRDGPASNGPGKRGGIGDGSDGGVGGGPGYGTDDGVGFTAIGFTGSITAPSVLYKVEPEFSEEARKGMQEKAEQGIWPTKSPLGYRNVAGLDGKKIIAIDPEVAPIVSKLFEWYATGQYALKEVAQKARDAGFIYRRTGASVPVSAVHSILRNRLTPVSLSGTANCSRGGKSRLFQWNCGNGFRAF